MEMIYFTILAILIGGMIYQLRRSIKQYSEDVNNNSQSLVEGIPIEWEILKDHQIPLITLTFAGKYRYTFLVDSGASHSYLDTEVLKSFSKSELKPLCSADFFGIDGTLRDAVIYNFSFSHRNSIFTDDFYVTDISALKELGVEAGINIHGILGISFLNKYGFSIDLNRMIVWRKL